MERPIQVNSDGLFPQRRVLLPDHALMGRTDPVIADENFYRAKGDLAPSKLLQGLGTSLTESKTWKNVLVVFIAKKVLGIFQKRRERRLLEEWLFCHSERSEEYHALPRTVAPTDRFVVPRNERNGE